MNVHIFNGEGLYKKSFLDFIDSNFDLNENLIILRSSDNYDKNLYSQNKSILIIQGGIKYFTTILPLLSKAENIYIHFLPVSISLIFWYIFRSLLKKTIWILWGGDLYYYYDRKKTLLSYFFEFLRKKIIKKIAVIACFIKGDYDLAKKWYKTNAEYCYTIYPLPTKLLQAGSRVGHSRKTTTILIGNSASPQNYQMEMLNVLSKFSKEDIKIICPLSYANEDGNTQNVIALGSKIFGDKFEFILEIMPPEDYQQILSDTDIAIMNHRRQQGLGNVLSLLFLEKKIYLRSDTTSYIYLESLGIDIFDTKEIVEQDFYSFKKFDPNLGSKNKKILSSEFSNVNYQKIWSNLLNLKIR
jgi:hypothetical protein